MDNTQTVRQYQTDLQSDSLAARIQNSPVRVAKGLSNLEAGLVALNAGLRNNVLGQAINFG